MKSSKIELNVDIIGGHGSLTIEEEKALSAFFKQRKSIIGKPLKSKRLRSVKQR